MKPENFRRSLEGEHDALAELRVFAKKNSQAVSMIGMGYYGTEVPSVVLRKLLENPAWYTAYTPYQAEISQGRLEMLFNFQTMVSDLTGLPVANASLLDEATAAAESMTLLHRMDKKNLGNRFLVDENIFCQTRDVLKTRSCFGNPVANYYNKKFYFNKRRIWCSDLLSSGRRLYPRLHKTSLCIERTRNRHRLHDRFISPDAFKISRSYGF